VLIQGISQALRGWAGYHRHGVSKAVFSAVDSHAWNRIMRWLRRKYQGRTGLGMPELRRRFCVPCTWKLAHNGVVFAGASTVPGPTTLTHPASSATWDMSPRCRRGVAPSAESRASDMRARC
jgi:hypothetical protein